MPERPRHLIYLGFVAAAATVLVTTAGGHGAPAPRAAAPGASWVGFVGEPRPAGEGAQRNVVVQRMLVVLKAPSLADRIAAAGGRASDAQHRRWTSQAVAAQKLVISRLGVQGVRIDPEFTYSRVLNGFSTPLDARGVALVERSDDVRAVYPVRTAFPATVATRELERPLFAPGMGRRPDVSLPGFDGRGVTIALLDTGVDRTQPYLAGRIRDGIDLLARDPDAPQAAAAANPAEPTELERHGTQLAGLMVGAGGPAGLSGVATGASILPIRVAGWQLDATGDWAVQSRTDLIVAGLERAVDPNDDGDAHDAARVAVVGVVEPYAAFADGPLARAAAGAARLDTLVVAPAGNEGIAGPGYGSISGPGGAPAALTVGAADLRREHEAARVTLRVGLNVVHDRVTPLVGSVAPERALNLAVAAPQLVDATAPPADQGAELSLIDFFDHRGYSRVAGRAALVPGGPHARRVARDAVRAGAAAILLYGPGVPAGALGLDEEVPVPVVRIPAPAAAELLAAARDGTDTGVSIGTASATPNRASARVATFSSRGLAFDGRVKPELTAAGVGLATAEPGSERYGTVNGSSASAAIVGGAAAVLAHARPELDALALKGVLVGSARKLRTGSVVAQGAGIVDVETAAATELAAEPPALALGRASVRGFIAVRRITIRNLSTRPLRLRVSVQRQGFPAAETVFEATPARLRLGAGRAARIRLEARVVETPDGVAPAEGAVVAAPVTGPAIRVPFALAFGPQRLPLVSGVRLSQRAFQPSDTEPAVLSLRAGAIRDVGGTPELHPASRLDLELYTDALEPLGVIARRRDVLPGWYTFGITGRDPEGKKLPPGFYRLRLVAFPTGGGRPVRVQVRFRIR